MAEQMDQQKSSWSFTLSSSREYINKGQPLLTSKKEETTPGCPATMPRGPGTAPLRHQGTLPSDIQPCNGTRTKLHQTHLQSSWQTSPSLIANMTTNTTCCTTRLHTIKIVNCWSAVVVIRTPTCSTSTSDMTDFTTKYAQLSLGILYPVCYI